MQAELRAANPDLNIEIVGVNRQDEAGFNSLITSSSTLAWLQDTPQQLVWNRWQVVWRDVRIHTLHVNPRIYHQRIVGDTLLNGSEELGPPFFLD